MRKKERVLNANKILDAIAAHWRRFFYNERAQRVSSFRLSPSGSLYFMDHYLGAMIQPLDEKGWDGFTNGGTLRALVEDLAQYIDTGRPIPSGHFGPWSPTLSRGDLWGYGVSEMAKVRGAIFSNPEIGRAHV